MHRVCDGHISSREGLDKFAHPESVKKKEGKVLIECPLRSHQMWLKGIKDSFEGG